MTNTAKSINQVSKVKKLHYTPQQLVQFFDSANIERPSFDILIDNANRYYYNKEQRRWLLKHYGYIKSNVKKIEEKINNAIKHCIEHKYNASKIKLHCNSLGLDEKGFRAVRNAVFDTVNPIAKALNQNRKIRKPDRIQAAMNHIHELHFRHGNFGNIIFGTPNVEDKSIWQFAVNKKDINEELVSKILTVKNLYVMVNTSKSFTRQTKDIGNINALYLDIDNVENPKKFVEQCESEGRFDKVRPSRINASGGGLHIYFYVDNAYANLKLNPYIKRIQKALLEIYPEADKLSDITRFLRLDGSSYEKPNKPKRIVRELYKSDKIYTINEIGPLLVPAYETMDKPIKKEVYSFSLNGLAKVPGTWRDLEVKRLRDIEYLASIGYFNSDKRKRAIYLYGLFVFRASGSFSAAFDAAHDLNKSLKRPLRSTEVENQISSIKDNGFNYRYKRDTVVQLLEIDETTLNDEQMSNLKALIPTKEKRARDYAKRKIVRQNKKNLTKREIEKKEKIDTIRTLLTQGLKQVDIVKQTGYSKSYVSQIVKQIKEEIKKD